jgi:hypothetical protein
MNLLQDYSLLIAVTLPVAAVAGMNLFLAFTGERDTLMLPGLMSFAPVEIDAWPTEVRVVREEGARKIDTVRAPANEELEELVA